MSEVRPYTTEDLERSESAIRFGITNHIPEEQLPVWAEGVDALLMPVVALLGGRDVVHLSSAYRSPEVNRHIGGSEKSQHTGHNDSCAFDLVPTVAGVREAFEIVRESIMELPIDQLIEEFDNWIHVSYAHGRVNRRECLIATKKDGRTIYTPIT